MKRKFNWFRTMNLILSGLLALLGFSACDEVINQKDMYGMPMVSYKLKGKVINEEKQPVSDIQIIIKQQRNQRSYPLDTIYTNSKGEFYYNDYEYPDGYWVIHRDTRNKNITYKTDSVYIEAQNNIEEITFELTEKKNDE